MESNAILGGICSNQQPGVLGNQNPHQMPRQQKNPLFINLEGDYHPQAQESSKRSYPFAAKSKNQSLTLNDDENENSADDEKKNMSPWHRMKWIDNMIRLLIMVVFYIGDEVGFEGNDPKKKSSGILQKKGKWKSVSRAMMEKGFYASPQQCEDKFNDLNKRYKRVNDILGKGIACRVVENQGLLESMDYISPKLKDEVRKLLNSKHLFFKEMCAYHSSCGHGSSGGVSVSGMGDSPREVAVDPHALEANKRCLHSTQNARGITSGGDEGSKFLKGTSDDSDVDDDHDDDDEEDGNNSMDERSRKRLKKGMNSPLFQQLNGELMKLVQDGTKGPLEKRQWMKMKLIGLEEERVGILSQAFELNKQRLKLLKFSSKKEREMEREKLTNERFKLENEKMVLLLRQKEMDLTDHQYQQ